MERAGPLRSPADPERCSAPRTGSPGAFSLARVVYHDGQGGLLSVVASARGRCFCHQCSEPTVRWHRPCSPRTGNGQESKMFLHVLLCPGFRGTAARTVLAAPYAREGERHVLSRFDPAFPTVPLPLVPGTVRSSSPGATHPPPVTPALACSCSPAVRARPGLLLFRPSLPHLPSAGHTRPPPSPSRCVSLPLSTVAPSPHCPPPIRSVPCTHPRPAPRISPRGTVYLLARLQRLTLTSASCDLPGPLRVLTLGSLSAPAPARYAC